MLEEGWQEQPPSLRCGLRWHGVLPPMPALACRMPPQPFSPQPLVGAQACTVSRAKAQRRASARNCARLRSGWSAPTTRASCATARTWALNTPRLRDRMNGWLCPCSPLSSLCGTL